MGLRIHDRGVRDAPIEEIVLSIRARVKSRTGAAQWPREGRGTVQHVSYCVSMAWRGAQARRDGMKYHTAESNCSPIRMAHTVWCATAG
jgi:hypothetical protein